jgi:hypothetical protein
MGRKSCSMGNFSPAKGRYHGWARQIVERVTGRQAHEIFDPVTRLRPQRREQREDGSLQLLQPGLRA